MKATQHKPCGKNRYASQREAIRNALAASRKSGYALRVYRCSKCKGWHLTKKPFRTTEGNGSRRTGAKPALSPPGRSDDGQQTGCSCGRCAWLDHEPSA
ncbi:hypothetical protein GCM10009788_44690 [Nocardioides humi]|uniref:Uncharacterized protein n=1 Tax=Nocardioides humi TaxID=449461 RepID=A0ABN2BD03_9ACTN